MATVKSNQPEGHASTDPSAAKAAVAEARRHLQAGDSDAAAAALRHVANRTDAPPAELAEAAKIMADAGSPVDAVSRYLESGRGFLEASDHGRARQSFVAAYEIDGKNLDALFELGRVDVAEGKKHDGLDKFVEVLRKSNLKHLPALYEAGCLYEQEGQHNQAILAFKRVVDRDKTHVSALEHLGSLHQVRNQLQDAVGYYARASEAANALFHYAEAKRLAELAIALDSGNANARRLLADAEKAIAAGNRPDPKAAQAKAAEAAPEVERPAAVEHKVVSQQARTNMVSDVTPVAPASADVVPPPPPSTLDLDMPADVALLEQQSQAMAQLAKVQNAVAQTYRQRMALEEEIRKAHAALEALERQQQSVEEDLSGKRDDLAKVVSEREAEEAALASLGDAITASKNELAQLAAISALIAEARTACSSAVDLAAKTTADLGAIGAQSSDARGKALAVDASVKELQGKLSTARQAADALERQHAEMAAAAKAAQEVADACTVQTSKSKAALDALAAKNREVEAASGALHGVGTTVEKKRAEAEAAIKRLEALQAQRKSQFEEIVFKLSPLGVSLPETKAAPAKAAAPTPSQAQAAAAPQAQAVAAPQAQAVAAPQAQAVAAPKAQAAAPQAQSAPKPQAAASQGQPAAPAKPTAVTAAQAQAADAKQDGAGPTSVDNLIAAGKFAEAAQRAQTEANAKPKPAEYLVEVGRRLSAAGRVEDAAKLFAAARDRDQNSAQARYELGSACVDLGKLDDALAMLKSVEGDPEFSVLGQVAIGRCLRRKGDLEGAEARFSKALEIEGRPDGDYHQALYHLADLHESKGDPDSLGLALWSYEELQSGNPNYGDVAQKIAKLKSQLAESGGRSEPARNGAIKQ